MKIAYYCQHVLGIGHFHRSLEICRVLAEFHQVTLILGGPEVSVDNPDISICQLPGLKMDARFNNLSPCDATLSLEEVKAQRAELLLTWFQQNSPDVFLVELYPFGRKAFRFELDPVLKGINERTIPPCRCFVSLRDILVERPNDQEKFEARIIKTLNNYFDGLLLHADEKVITLGETFSRINDINIPTVYTGFITRESSKKDRHELRQSLAVQDDDKLIVVSIGGGNVGHELVKAAIQAFTLLTDIRCRMQLFTGPYFPEETFTNLQVSLPENVCLSRFTDHFPDWLLAADLSISMAGYNTCMNLLAAGIPALVYPFSQNREQRYRVKKLQQFGTFRILEEHDLTAALLAKTIEQHVSMPRYRCTIKLDGAQQTRTWIENIFHDQPTATI
ncbi:glycosyltransferase family protein [Desulfopila sp. IMCC35008]|uniref:glycosyltransferase family protein n=1 Tax=Desulfopila sp. IMCC35008 TaxID=2653858 RepID=UPI0013D88C7E|nr:glycosyltransferase [Desulfopila sp. IMCC35008]